MATSETDARKRVTRDAATIIGFSSQAIGITLTAEDDTEFDRITLVSQTLTLPLQIIILSYQDEVTYTVLDLLHSTAETYSTVRDTLDAMEDMQIRVEQEQGQE